MQIGYKMMRETEYMYASARIRAAEGRDTAKMRLERMLECRNTEQLLRTVLEFGFLQEGKMPDSLSAFQAAALNDAVLLLRQSVPQPEIYDFLLYKYDCNNIKVAIKSTILQRDYSGLYYHCGTFPAEGLTERLSAGNTEGLPTHMASAVREAKEQYAKSGEGRVIDFIMDCACFADMAENVAASGNILFRAYVSALADITNIRSSVRLATRGSREISAAIFAQAFVTGGHLEKSFFMGEDGCLGYDGIVDRLDAGVLRDAVASLIGTGAVHRPDKVFDDYLYCIMNQLRYQPFGAHVPAAFLVNREAELKNCRIIEAGLTAGYTGQTLRERVRAAYV